MANVTDAKLNISWPTYFNVTTQMTMELDVFVGNTTIMDEEVYQLWLDGYTGKSQIGGSPYHNVVQQTGHPDE